MTGVFIKRGHLDTGTQRKDSHVKAEADIGVMHLHARKHQGLLTTP